MKKKVFKLVSWQIALLVLCAVSYGATTTSISQHGITWNFSSAVTYGQFVNGDYWVVGPVTVSSVSPAWDGVRNGSMVDPCTLGSQGYRANLDLTYDSNLRTTFPVTLNGVTSLVSTIGLQDINPGGAHEGIDIAAVLTVVNGTVPSGSFRPPYVHGSKPFHNTSDINYSSIPLLDLPPGATMPSLTNVMTKVWLDHTGVRGNAGASMHPSGNMPPYPRDSSLQMSTMATALLVDSANRNEYINRMIQLGIDLYHCHLTNGDAWRAYGGFGSGRKWPILFAGIALGNTNMQNPTETTPACCCLTGTVRKFGEDGHTYYGEPTPEYPDGRPLWGQDCTAGMYDFNKETGGGDKDCRDPDGIAQNDSYRICCTSHSWVGGALAAHIMDATAIWDYNAFFDYVDWWVCCDGQTSVHTYGGDFIEDMWIAYRDYDVNDTTVPTPDPMTWATEPYATGDSSISMTATTATDESGVEYYFECTAGGGHNSGWQNDATYEDAGLSPSTQYTYKVKARDKSSNQNETGYSTTKSATTDAADTTPPSPDPMTWASEPNATGGTSISMTATTATDASGAEYYFDETSGNPGGSDSGWQDSSTYTDTGLDVNTTYSYQVKARDKSSNQNETAYSTLKSATTNESEPITSTTSWQSFSITNQTGSFTFEFDAEPTNNNIDACVGTASGVVDAYGDLATTARFYTSGYMDVRNGSSFAADASVPYSAGNIYHVRMEIDIPSYTYSVYVTPQGQSEVTLASNYAFRDGQESVTNQDCWALKHDIAAVAVDNVEVTTGGADTTPPSPDPMTWATVPYATGTSSISMTATTATDASGVEYYFDETSGNPGGSDSSWQDSSTYEDTGLNAGTQYTYQVKARDKSTNQNETAYSTSESATTDTDDTTPPSPDPMTWATEPYATGTSSISMTATTATDASGVEYYFDETSGNPGSSDSGWQDSSTYDDTGLDANTIYTYQVKVRDKSVNQNETAYSTSKSATTNAAGGGQPTLTVEEVPGDYYTITAHDSVDPNTEYWKMQVDVQTGGIFNFKDLTDDGDGMGDHTSYTDTNAYNRQTTLIRLQGRGGQLYSRKDPVADLANKLTFTTAGDNSSFTIKYEETPSTSGYYHGSYADGDLSLSPGELLTTITLVIKPPDSNGTFWDLTAEYENVCAHDLSAKIWAADYAELWIWDDITKSSDSETSRVDGVWDPCNPQSYVRWTIDSNPSMGLTNGREFIIDRQVGLDGYDYGGGFANGSWAGHDYIRYGACHGLYASEALPPSAIRTDSGQFIIDIVGQEAAPDTTAPSPNPMTWATVPYATGDSSISMTATTATDASGVEYYFDETSGNPGGSDSGWQDSATYEDTGLSASTQYTYQVKARDKSTNQNETAYSTSESATTDATPDTDPPGPNPMTWATVPYATGASSISMTATTATDASGVEYYFKETSGNPGGSDSGWQDSATYEDTGLNELTQYTYQVKARDKSSNQNETAYSTSQSATTEDGTAPSPDPMTWAMVPYATGASSISMTATTATDASGVEYYFDETSGNPGGSDSGWQDSATYEDTGLNELTQYTYQVKARDKSTNQNETTYSTSESATTDATPDTDPPSPDPMTWAMVPYATGASSISMTATTATDASGVEYYFKETSGNPGGSDSGWQDSATYEDTGLNELTQYTYQVKARDKSSNQNETAYSTSQSATTEDGTAPSPDPMTWAMVPYATGASSISMTATTATDASGVEYYFDETSGNPGGNDSGWQDSATYQDAGLSPSTQYSYQVKARDKSGNQNETSYSTIESATTDAEAGPAPVSWWKLDESGGTNAADSSGNGHDGTLSGGSWAPASGKFNGAVSLGAANTDYVQVPTTSMSASAGTISVWGRMQGTQSGGRFFFGHTSTIPSTWSDRIQLYMDNIDNQLDLGLGDSHFLHTNITTLSVDTWYHIALTWDGTNYVVYVDGIEKASGTYTGLATLGSYAHIGNNGDTGGAYLNEAFQGLLDEVLIYDEALSKYDVADLAGITIASNPSPADSATGVDTDADLSWSSGYYAADVNGHDVYLGTDFNSVADANQSSAEFKGNQSSTTYDPGTMDADTTYYWAIDEVNDTNTWPGDVWSFTTAAAAAPGQASNPSPADGATDVSIDADLSWTAGSGADSHDVYFGTTSPGDFQGNQTSTTFDPGTMANDTTYYWRIDEVNAGGTTTGVAWSFTTEAAPPPPPSQATNPSPAGGATDVGVDADLSWTVGSGADSHDVYFGTTSPGTFQGNQTGTTFDPGAMANDTTYYWRIDEVNAGGTTTGVVWSFTTEVAAALEIYVNDIAMSYKVAGPNRNGIATVWIKDTSGADIEGATVYGDWSGLVSESDSGITGTDGKVTLSSSKIKSGGTFTFTVTDVVKSGYTYNSSLNVETSDSVTVP